MEQIKNIVPQQMEETNQLFAQMYGEEDISRREENVKHFNLGENRYQAITYAGPVHFRDEKGKWQDIDNTLEETVNAQGRKVLRNRANRFRVELPSRIDGGNLVSVTRGGKTFAWRFEQEPSNVEALASVRTGEELRQERLVKLAQRKSQYVGRTADSLRAANLAVELESAQERRAELPAMKAQAQYNEVLPGVSVRYTVIGDALKEDILLSCAEALSRAAIRLPGDYRYEVGPDSALHVLDKQTGKMEFMMGIPMVYDAEDKRTEAQVRLTDCGAYTRMVYVLDAEYMENAVYPVTIDPVVHTEISKDSIADAYIWKYAPNTNYGDVHLMRCGNGEGGESISLIKFNKLVKQRASDTILSAQLRMAVKNFGSTNEYMACYPVKAAWTESGVTWNKMTPADNSKIGDEVLSYIKTTNPTQFHLFDITEIYRSWYKKDANGNSVNFGVALRYPKGVNGADQYVEWFASKHDIDYMPCVYVNYVSHAGRKSWWEYETMAVGRAGTAYADLFNGNLILEHGDSATSGARMPVSVSHVYNSCLSSSNPVGCGMGWRTSMHHSLRKQSYNSGDTKRTYYVWTDGDATEHFFEITGKAPFKDAEGMELKLDDTATDITITDKSHSVMTFPKATSTTEQYLKKIADSCGNTMTVNYDAAVRGRILSVKDGVGRLTSFAYNAAGLLESITAPGCPVVSYTYDSDNHLTHIGYSDLTSGGTEYTYEDGANLLTGVRNYDGVKLDITFEPAASYDSAAISDFAAQARRVIALEMSAGATKGAKKCIEYLSLTTRVTAVKDTASDAGKTITYQFNSGGNVVSTYDELGFAQFNTFSASVANQQTGSSKLQKAVVNLLKNIDFSENWSAVGKGTAQQDAVARCLNIPSAKLTKTAQGELAYRQTLTLPAAGFYTFSAYAKSAGELANGGLFLRASVGSAGASVHTSRRIMESTESLGTKASEGWDRLFISFEAAANQTVTLDLVDTASEGSAWFACPQLETGKIPNRVNLLVNGDFSRTRASGSQTFAESWIPSDGISTVASNGVISAEAAGMPAVLTGQAMRIHSYCNTGKASHCQTVPAKGSKGDVYVLGGWADSTSVASSSGDEKFKPCLITNFKKTDGTWTGWAYHEYGAEHVGWKFGAWAVAAPENYTEFTFGVQYARNSGTAVFTNVFVHREEFGESFGYDSKKNLISASNLSGDKADMKYDAFDNLTSYHQPGAPADALYTMTYGDTDAAKKKHLVLTEATPMGVKQAYTYDAYGNRLTAKSQKDTASPLIQSNTVYDANGNYAVEAVDARGNKVTKTIDPTSGLVYNVSDPEGQTVNYTYDAAKRVTAVESTADDAVYKNAYTYENDRLKTVSHNTTGANCDVTYTFGYDALGRKTTVKVGNQLLSENIYSDDRDGILDEVRYGNGGKVKYEYDDFDQLKTVRYDGETAPRYAYEYGANGQASFVRDNKLGRTLQTEYDLSKRPCQSTIRDAETEELIYRTTLTYDKQNRLASFKEHLPNEAHETAFKYDNDNRTTKITYDGEANAVAYEYDAIGRVSKRTVKSGDSEYISEYAFVEGDKVMYGANATTSLVKSITQGSGDNAMNFEYEYDTRGNIVAETRNGLTTRYEYDALGQLIYVNDPHENAVWFYKYDQGGNILEKRKYTRDEDGLTGNLLKSIPYEYGDPNWKDKLTSYIGKPITYDAIGNPLDDGERRYEWTAGRQLAAVIMKASLEECENIMDGVDEESGTKVTLEFTNGQVLEGNATITAKAKVFFGEGDVTEAMPASAFNWKRETGDVVEDAIWNVAHAGEREITLTAADLDGDTQIRCEVTCTSTEGQYGTVHVDNTFMASHTPSVTDANDILTVQDGDLIISTTNSPTYSVQEGVLKVHTWFAGKLTASAKVFAELPDKLVEFKYNHAGLRTQKKVILPGRTVTTEYTLHGKLITALNDGENQLHFFYDAQSRPVKVNFNGANYDYVQNLQGDIVGIIDAAGACVVEYKYDGWGRMLAATGLLVDSIGKVNPFRYRGYVYDEEIALYHLRNRYYDPVKMRFINADSFGGGFGRVLAHNLFAYCSNAPVIFSDPSGKSWENLIMAVAYASLITAAVVIGAAVVIAACQGSTTNNTYNPPKTINPAQDYGITSTIHAGQDHMLVGTFEKSYVINYEQSKAINDSREAAAKELAIGQTAFWGVGGIACTFLVSKTVGAVFGVVALFSSMQNVLFGYSGDDDQYMGTTTTRVAAYERQTAEGTSIFVVRETISSNPHLSRNIEIFPMDIALSPEDLESLCTPGYS